MGAGQSSGNGAGDNAQAIKTSYYELLGVTRQATEEDIKKAYRKKALQLHPDRNFGNEEAATKLFAEIQAAHEVLSDPQERAWYDSHESAILRGDDGGADGEAPTYENIRVTTADDLARMIRKFNSKVEFTDEPSGFFGFIRTTFEQLAREEEIAGNMEGVEAREYPGFGYKDDDYNDGVKHFYAAWSSFSTVKTFSWLDKYRLSEAPDRWYRRRMEQENHHIRQDGKRAFNDAVRSLLAFVRKRDPRYEPSTQTEAERQQTLREAAAAQAARARAANAAKMEGDVPAWTRVREPDELQESSEEEVVEEVFECVACNKLFKSERQWEAHEKSKKHQKAVRALQAKMRKENAHLDLVGGEDLAEDEYPVMEAREDPSDDVHAANEGDEGNGHITDDEADLDEATLDDEDGIKEQPSNEGRSNEHISEPDAHVPNPPSNPLNKPDQDLGDKNPSPTTLSTSDDDDDDDDYASLSTIQARLQSAHLDAHTSDEDEIKSSKPKLGKAAQKRARRAAAAAVAAANAAGAGTDPAADGGQTCQICQESFPSKTKLFQHIKEEGHAAVKTTEYSGKNKGKKGKGKR